MLKKIWQSFVRWFRKLFGRGAGASRDRLVSTAELPPLDDTDREYLFMQLLEGVAHGWQQPRAIGFFNKIRQRVRKSEWLEWLDRFGNNLLNAPVPNYELAGRMVQLSELDCGEIGDLAGEYGVRLLNRQAEEFPGDLLPIMEFSSLESAEMDGENISYGGSVGDNRHFAEVPMELLIDNDPLPSPPPRSISPQSEAENSASETREITLEEFSAMLYKDPDLVAELAEQFGVETTDPQVIVNAVVAQMQQQVQQISGDLTPADRAETPEPPPIPTPPETPPATPPEIPTNPPSTPPATPPEIPPVMPPEVPPVAPPAPPAVPPAMPPTTPPLTPEALTSTPSIIPPVKQVPPPPPAPKLDYRSEDPWNSSNLLGNNEQAVPEAAQMPDRGV
jgi:hypothetical protein